ncbi:DNA-binding protein (plasmid) [Pseudomonas aeruginosa]|jgi:Fanconi anemia group M protein|uniref:Helix-hairpin-helix domain-containing protein n=1 Tax=Pseudomonas asiatica TaxID=2219225 RepID=A0AAJ5IDS0_9PSED|nr:MULTISPECIES: ERCC4 domain-containing protein [Pseudomonas]MCP8473021.1 helix-hairpin-helix domain-containing protein [Pseudomonas triclosanedens]AGL46353.1 putative DNA-binding protein [Pseudomonas aeruginosa PA96]EIW4149480.1 DNA-binding protein [Pseudomonas aeruginosa]EKU2925298.1 DNA-binding protein [Pseudomonas aeruginosa]EKU5857696.1 DNA-binding protein [Pseudomonas aeruginosa]
MVKIFVDAREVPSRIPDALREMGAEVEIVNLEVGDYVLSADLVLERKTALDFCMSVTDGRFINQSSKMMMNFKRRIWLIEGDVYSTRAQIHPDALDGALSYLAVVLQQTVLWYKAPRRAAGMIYRLAKHEQEGLDYVPATRKGKVPAGVGQSLFTLEGLNGCGPVAARKLLEHFRSVHAVINASVEQLCAVKGIGPKKAQAIYDGIHFQVSEGMSVEEQPSLFADPPASDPLV